jgi:hypothetical protein
VHKADCFALNLGRLKVVLEFSYSLLFSYLIDYLVPKSEEKDGLHFETSSLKELESVGVGLQSTIASQVLSFVFFIVANPIFDTPAVVALFHDVFVRPKTCEDRHLVHLVLLQTHEEIVYVSVFALHHNLRECSWQLFLFRRQ